MLTQVLKASPAREFLTAERCRILELANDSADESVSVARARVGPGVATARHRLTGIDERYIILAGTGRVELEGLEPVDVAAGDVVRIAAGASQSILNTGQVDLEFLCVCSPRFRQECYVALE